MARNKRNGAKSDRTWDIYADSVLNGTIVACKWVRLACKRYKDDLNRPHLHFDADAAQDAINFFSLVPHVKGEWAGNRIQSEPWQQFVVANLFGWKMTSTKLRRFRKGFLEVARKNAKSTTLAALGLYLMRFDGEPGAEVYSAATTRDQSKVVFDIAKEMVNRSALRKHLHSYKTNIHCTETASKFEPLSSDYNSLDGLNIHAAIIDELHAHKTRDLYDVLDTATGARRQPIIISITTAGYDRQSVCWQEHTYTEKILEGTIEDDSFWGIIYTVDEGDDWEDEAVWVKANPNLDVSVKIDDLRAKAKKAKEMPTQLNAFLQKHLNVWTESVTRWIPVDKWDACDMPVTETSLSGWTCYSGLDLSSTTDITALVHCFPPQQGVEHYQLVCRFFIPEDNMRDRSRRDRVPYDVWERQGFITATSGNVVDYAWVLSQIAQDKQAFYMKELAFDRWGSQKLVADLVGELDFTVDDKAATYGSQTLLVQFGQGFASMSSPTKELEKLVLERRIAHGCNPVLRWMCSNVVVKQDPAGNLKPDKSQSVERIDGIVAAIMALDRATRQVEAEGPNILVL